MQYLLESATGRGHFEERCVDARVEIGSSWPRIGYNVFVVTFAAVLLFLRLHTVQLVAQHIPLQEVSTSLSSSWELPDAFTELFFRVLQYRSCAVSRSQMKLRTHSNTALRASAFCPHAVDNRLFNAFVPQEPRGPFLPATIVFHFATLVHVMTQQLSTGKHY
jgi:hypothetical protein